MSLLLMLCLQLLSKNKLLVIQLLLLMLVKINMELFWHSLNRVLLLNWELPLFMLFLLSAGRKINDLNLLIYLKIFFLLKLDKNQNCRSFTNETLLLS